MEIVAAPTRQVRRGDSPRLDPLLDGAVARNELRAAQREILVDTAARLRAGEDPDRQVVPALFEALATRSIVDATFGFVACEMAQGLKLGFMHGFDPRMVQLCLALDFGQAVSGTGTGSGAGLGAATRRAMHVTDIQQLLDPLAGLVRSAGITAYACEPLIAGGRLLGTISFGSRTRRRFEADEILLFRNLAKLLAAARYRGRLQVRETRAA